MVLKQRALVCPPTEWGIGAFLPQVCEPLPQERQHLGRASGVTQLGPSGKRTLLEFLYLGGIGRVEVNLTLCWETTPTPTCPSPALRHSTGAQKGGSASLPPPLSALCLLQPQFLPPQQVVNRPISQDFLPLSAVDLGISTP